MASKRTRPVFILDRCATRGWVDEPDGRRFLFEIEKDAVVGPAVPPEGLHFGMWLQPPDRCQMDDDPGDYPYDAAKAFLLHKYWLNRIMDAFVLLVAAECSSGVRDLAGPELEEKIDAATPAAVEEFRQILLQTPWPPGVATKHVALGGRAGEIFAEAVARHGHAP